MTDHLRPLGLTRLPDGALACRHCGVAVPRSEAARIDRLSMIGYVPSDRAEQAAQRARKAEEHDVFGSEAPPMHDAVEFAVCAACALAEVRAERIAEAHPAARRRIGGVLRSRLVTALLTLDLLGYGMSDEQADSLSDHGALLLAESVGLSPLTRWADDFHPVARPGAVPLTCAPARFGHVGADSRASARRQYAALLAARADRPEVVACPSGGCQWCGVGAVTAMHSRAGLTWFAQSVGHLCASCEAVRSVGGNVVGAWWEHVDADRAIRRRSFDVPRVEGVVPWSSLRRKPGAEPWSHIDSAPLLASYAPSPVPRTIVLDAALSAR